MEVSTIHQLVDGGVTESIQLQDIDRTLGMSDSDHVIVLTTGELRAKTTSAEEVRGGLNIALASLEYLWENYQQKTVSSALGDAFYRPYMAAARRQLGQAGLWREEVKKMLGEEEFRRLESRMQTRFPTPSPQFQRALEASVVSTAPIFHIFTPEARIFTDTFESDLASINTALYFGCAMAANYAKNPRREGVSEPDEFDTVRIVKTGRGNDDCVPVLKPAKSHKPAFTDYFSELLTYISANKLSFDELKQRAESGDMADKVRWCAVVTTYSHREHGYHPEEGLAACRELAAKGDPMGMLLLGRMLENGSGVPQNLEEAARLYERVAAEGIPYAMVGLGYMYKGGRGVPKNRDRALQLFGMAADRGLPDAFNALGELHRDSAPANQISQEAMLWFRRAAAEGHRQGVENMMRLIQEAPQD